MNEAVGVMSGVFATLARFGPPAWLDQGQIDPAFFHLSPRGSRSLTAERTDEVEKVFEPQGPFPAMKIGAAN